jgi:hypothetical protein
VRSFPLSARPEFSEHRAGLAFSRIEVIRTTRSFVFITSWDELREFPY